ncbi:hypothetical protein [Rhizobium paknamense]|uniref:Anti-sigma factor n=1 Tax=Rhizobium paknamense TaxID=1206817 RepID=A0ABU0IDU8_9HYPH|nr:hypothetical protein [Rhizobium paknamense]MDQ0456400.1 hypothetical protein [Rhizobium paknamense]
MNLSRFRQLTEAYGADFFRWPEEYRASARAFAAEHDVTDLLEETHQFDALLMSAARFSPTQALTETIIRKGEQQFAWRRRWRRWWIGMGVLAVGLAGGLSGAVAVAVITPQQGLYGEDPVTAFGIVQNDAAGETP